MAERKSIIKEVILEAEAFGDIETQAEMMVQAAILDLQEGCPTADIEILLQVWAQRRNCWLFFDTFFFCRVRTADASIK